MQVGEGVTNFKVGDRVGGAWGAGSDLTCKSCRRGDFQLCDDVLYTAARRMVAGASTQLSDPRQPLPFQRTWNPADAVPLLCAGVTAFNCIRKMRIEQGGLVAVQGLGGLGHLAVKYARNMGHEVAAISSGDAKEQFAKDLEAHHYIKVDPSTQLQQLGGASLILSAAPNAKAASSIITGLASGGKLTLISACGNVEFNLGFMILKNWSVHRWVSGHALDAEEAIKFARTRGIKCMIEKYPFSKAQDAIDSFKEGRPRFRNVLVMGS